MKTFLPGETRIFPRYVPLNQNQLRSYNRKAVTKKTMFKMAVSAHLRTNIFHSLEMKLMKSAILPGLLFDKGILWWRR